MARDGTSQIFLQNTLFTNLFIISLVTVRKICYFSTPRAKATSSRFRRRSPTPIRELKILDLPSTLPPLPSYRKVMGITDSEYFLALSVKTAVSILGTTSSVTFFSLDGLPLEQFDMSLTYFMSQVLFYTPWKHQKIQKQPPEVLCKESSKFQNLLVIESFKL